MVTFPASISYCFCACYFCSDVFLTCCTHSLFSPVYGCSVVVGVCVCVCVCVCVYEVVAGINKNSRYFHFPFSPQNCLLGVGLEFIYTQHYAITFCFFPWLTVCTVYGIRLNGCMVVNVEFWVFSLYCFCCSYSFFNSWRR